MNYETFNDETPQAQGVDQEEENRKLVQARNQIIGMMDMDQPVILSRSNSQVSVSSQVARERDDLIKQLVIMGVNPDVAKLAAVKVEYRSLEAALDYIFGKSSNGLFSHDYLEGPKDACYLCQEPADRHNRR